MAVKRRVNWISQQRVDTPDMRSLESAASNDFDELIKSLVTGTDIGYVIRGFKISMAGAVGGAASGLQLLVDPGAVLHINSSQSGTFYLVPTGTPAQQLNSATNTIVDGAFSPSSINYVGIEYERVIDDTTSSQVYLWNPTTNNETTKNAPRATILRYRIKISTSTPASTVLPIAAVLTDSGNNVVSISDARYLLGRLGTGGFTPDPFNSYAWSEGKTENPSTSSSNSVSPFEGGDKAIDSLKSWMDAVMTSLKEIKGTTYWYSDNTAGSIESLRQDLGNTVITGRGMISHSKVTAGLLNWDQDIQVRVIGSRLAYTLLANASSSDITLTDDRAAYITLVRGVAIVPNLIFTNGSAVVTSVGAVTWTTGLVAGDYVKLAAENDSKYYKILTVDSVSQITLTEVFADTSTGAPGAKAQYAYGSYQSSPTPSTSRHIYIADRKSVPEGENVFWLFLRSDNGGSIPRVYIRFLGSELSQGESEDISDNIPLNILQYMGSPIESATEPQYVESLNSGSLQEITDLKFGTAATITSNQYFYISSPADARLYYVWFDKNGTGVDPVAPGANSKITVAIATGDTAAQVAAKVATAMNSTATFYGDFEAVQRANPNTDTVRVTNKSAGSCSDAVNFNVGAPFAVTIIQQGTGEGNIVIQDDDNLTLGIKKLDRAIGDIFESIDDPSYDEAVDIVAHTATGSILTLPLNTRMSNTQQKYTVGKGTLQFYLNGQFQRLGVDYAEVGAALAISQTIQLLRDLESGDTIEYRTNGLGAGAGSGGGVGPQGPPGPAGIPGVDALGGPVAVSTKSSNYTVLLSDNVLKANCAGGAVIFQLPTAASSVGHAFYFKKSDATLNKMTIQAFGVELIDGLNFIDTDVQYESFMIVSDGTVWSIH